MKKTFSTIAVAMLAGAAFLGAAEPAAAKDYEYCRLDYASGMQSCGFNTIEQCLGGISGRGGSCARNPPLSVASVSYAYAPKRHGRAHR
jgi:Protein of unknown function (DUF3551)